MKKFRGRTCATLAGLLLTTPAWGDVGAEMDAEADVGAQMSAEAEGEGGEGEAEAEGEGEGEAKAGGEAAAAGPAAAPVAAMDKFAAPSGHTGAGLSLSPAQKGRAYLELAFHTQSNYFVLSPVLGGGYKVADKVELELVVPMVYASFDVGFVDDSAFKLGNIYAGANYLGGDSKLKFKVGGGLGLPTSSASDAAGIFAYGGATAINGGQALYLWAPEYLSMNAIGRVEYGVSDTVVLTGDSSLGVYFPIGDAAGDNEFTFTLAPGVGAWLSESALVGGRFMLVYYSAGGDNAQLALEPYFRYDLDSLFLETRFLANLDEPYGFAFDDGGFWAWFVGAGLTF